MEMEARPSGAAGLCMVSKAQLDPRKAGLIPRILRTESGGMGAGRLGRVQGQCETEQAWDGGLAGPEALHSLMQPRFLEHPPRAGRWGPSTGLSPPGAHIELGHAGRRHHRNHRQKGTVTLGKGSRAAEQGRAGRGRPGRKSVWPERLAGLSGRQGKDSWEVQMVVAWTGRRAAGAAKGPDAGVLGG